MSKYFTPNTRHTTFYIHTQIKKQAKTKQTEQVRLIIFGQKPVTIQGQGQDKKQKTHMCLCKQNKHKTIWK